MRWDLNEDEEENEDDSEGFCDATMHLNEDEKDSEGSLFIAC